MSRVRLQCIITVGCHWLLAASALPSAGASEPFANPVTKFPHRIVAIAPNSAEVICTLGACDRIVGVSKFCVYPPELLDRPRVGGLSDPDLERIAALRPDLLVMRGKNDALERLCEELRVPIYRDETDTLPGIENCLREMGERLGLIDRATVITKDLHERIDMIRSRNAGKPKPRVLLTVSRQPDRLANVLTTGKGTFLDQMIEIAGGVNVFGHLDMHYPQVSPEGMLAQQPEVIIELMPDLKLTDALKEQMSEQWNQLGSMPAVMKNRIYVITDENGLIPSPRYVEIIDKVSRLLHSEFDVAP